MKTTLFIAISLLASASWACPNFAGSYTCTSDQDQYDTIVTQSEYNGVTTYMFDDTQIIADGQEHELDTDDDSAAFTYTASCVGETLVGKVKGDFSENGQKVGSMETDYLGQFNANGEFVQSVKGHFNYNGQKHPVDQTEVCVRK